MTNARLEHIRKTALENQSRNPSCTAVILELCAYIDKLKQPKVDNAQVALLKEAATRWFRRRATTPFDKAEERAIRDASTKTITETDLALLDWWYSLPEKDCLEKYGAGRRKTVASLFNNIGMEILKAEKAHETLPKQPVQQTDTQIDEEDYLKWLDSQDWQGRMRDEWRSVKTAPEILLNKYLEEKAC